MVSCSPKRGLLPSPQHKRGQKGQRSSPQCWLSPSPTLRALPHGSRRGRAEQWQWLLSCLATDWHLHPKGRLMKSSRIRRWAGLKSQESKLYCCHFPSSTHPKGSRSSPPTANGPRGSHLKQTRDNYYKSQSSQAPGLLGAWTWLPGLGTRETPAWTITQGIFQSGPWQRLTLIMLQWLNTKL